MNPSIRLVVPFGFVCLESSKTTSELLNSADEAVSGRNQRKSASRLTCLLLLLCWLVAFGSVAAEAQRTFYIDYTGGSNSNSGTSPSSPWKSHPYMQKTDGCAGSAPTYSHAAGDRFIFRGGVTWPSACFGMSPAAGGSSTSTRDYYGVDPAFFAGSSWTRPIFDLGGLIPKGGYAIQINGVSNFTLDNFEIKNQRVTAGTNNECGVVLNNTSNVLVTNLYLHDWKQPDMGPGSTGNHDQGGICAVTQAGARNVVADHITASDASPGAPNQPFGGCFHNVETVQFSTCHDVPDAIVGYVFAHDNEMYNIVENNVDTSIHENVMENFGVGGATYNNLIHDTHAGVDLLICAGDIYNNVIYRTNKIPIAVDTNCGGDSSATANVYNNTLECGGGACVRVVERGSSLGKLNVRNNHFINGSGSCYNNPSGGCSRVGSVVDENNISMSTSAANSQGYTAANNYAPSSASDGTVNIGVNLSASCSGDLSLLCKDRLGMARPSDSWDVGAYEFGSVSATKPAPPSNLTAVVH